MKFVCLNLASAVVLSVCASAGRTDESGRPFASLGKKLALMQDEDGIPEECSNAIQEFLDASENINENCNISLGSGGAGGGAGGGFGGGAGFGGGFGGGFMNSMQSSFNGGGGFTTGGFNYTDAEIQEGCDDFNEFCADDLEALSAASSSLLESCRAIGDGTQSREAFENFPIEEFFQAQNSEGLDCDSQFRPGGECTDECREVAETFVEEAGCCFAAFSSISLVTDGRLADWANGNGRVSIELTVCDIDLEMCDEGTELLDNVGVGVSDSTDGNGSGNGESGNAGSALAIEQSLTLLVTSSAVWAIAQ